MAGTAIAREAVIISCSYTSASFVVILISIAPLIPSSAVAWIAVMVETLAAATSLGHSTSVMPVPVSWNIS